MATIDIRTEDTPSLVERFKTVTSSNGSVSFSEAYSKNLITQASVVQVTKKTTAITAVL